MPSIIFCTYSEKEMSVEQISTSTHSATAMRGPDNRLCHRLQFFAGTMSRQEARYLDPEDIDIVILSVTIIFVNAKG